MMMRTLLAFVACSLYVASPAAAQVTRPIKFPIHAEMTVAFSGPQYETAEFPGISAALAVMFPLSPNHGIGGVGEMEASYVRLTRAAGGRVYRRINHTTLFSQLLVGSASGGYSGLITSTGGALIQPGVGVRIGNSAFSFHLQVDYRYIESGRIYDARDGSSTSQSGVRYMAGVSYRAGR